MDPYLNWNVLLLVHCAYHNGIMLLLPPPSLPIPHACCMWRGFGVAPGTSAACCKTLPNCKMLIHLCITYWCRCVTCSLQVWSCVVCRYLFFFPTFPLYSWLPHFELPPYTHTSWSLGRVDSTRYFLCKALRECGMGPLPACHWIGLIRDCWLQSLKCTVTLTVCTVCLDISQHCLSMQSLPNKAG